MSKFISKIRKLILLAGLSAAVFSATTASAQNRSFGTCYAYTDCYNRFGQWAGTISCSVSGDSSAGVACNWRTIAFRSVACNGYAFDQWGNWGWVSVWDSCARFY